MKKKIILVLLFIVSSFSIMACAPKNPVKIGKYYFTDDIYIEVKADMKLSFHNVDFSDVQDYYDEVGIDINIYERTQGDIAFELSDEGEKIFVLTDETVVLNLSYNKESNTLFFGSDAYILKDK